MKRKIYFGLGISLLIIAAWMMLGPDRGKDDVIGKTHPTTKPRAEVRRTDAAGARTPDGKRTGREHSWKHAKELPFEDDQTEPVESPVFLGFLQSDPTNT